MNKKIPIQLTAVGLILGMAPNPCSAVVLTVDNMCGRLVVHKDERGFEWMKNELKEWCTAQSKQPTPEADAILSNIFVGPSSIDPFRRPFQWRELCIKKISDSFDNWCKPKP